MIETTSNLNPIYFRGNPFSAKKYYFGGTHRIQSPEDTWRAIAPLASRIGITRVSNITGLDNIGIPVSLAIRPNSKTLSVSSGKGLNLVTSKVSGFMESLELYCAEEYSPPCIKLPYNELIKRVLAPPTTHFLYRKNNIFHPDLPESWVLGWDLFQEQEIAVPESSVLLNFDDKVSKSYARTAFCRSSNGLASGAHFLEALSSGIYEVIERDAVTCCLFSNKISPRVNLESIRYPSVVKLIQHLEAAGAILELYDCTLDIEVPVFKAAIIDKFGKYGAFGGYGAHLDPEVSMVRAITEAIQGRAVIIAGSRDDFFYDDNLKRSFDCESVRGALKDPSPIIDASSYRSEACATLEEDIHILMNKLRKVGLPHLVVVDLSIPEFGVSVVRVLIPGLEGYHDSKFATGFRAQKYMENNKVIASEDYRSTRNEIHMPAGGV